MDNPTYWLPHEAIIYNWATDRSLEIPYNCEINILHHGSDLGQGAALQPGLGT